MQVVRSIDRGASACVRVSPDYADCPIVMIGGFADRLTLHRHVALPGCN
jgi:hypothetical protein